jgi:DNA-binding CsgD family transcriptional regulator
MIAIGNLGWNALGHGNLEQSHVRFNQSLALARENENAYFIAHYSGGLAYVALDQGDYQQARLILTEVLPFFRDVADLGYVCMCFDGIGRTAVALGQPERAARLMGFAHALREQLGQPPVEAFLAPQLNRDLASARAQLGVDAFASAWEDGRRMALDDAIDFALSDEPLTESQDIAQSGIVTNLSPREFDVLRLIVEGKTDREIAVELFISHHTVARHVSNILGKLDVESRTAAATFAMRHNLI